MVIERAVQVAEAERLVEFGLELNLISKPAIELPPAPVIICDFLVHLPDYWRTFWIDDTFTLFIRTLGLEISRRRPAWPQAHFNPGSQSALHVYALVIVLELRLTTENHQKELLVWRVGESLPIRLDMDELFLVHQIYERPEVACISA